MTSDPIGLLAGGLNTYSYVGGNPLRFWDPYGLEPWTWDGQGDTSLCDYYKQQAKQNPGCSYSGKAEKICKGENIIVNWRINQGIKDAWRGGSSLSQSETLNEIRKSLIYYDQQARNEGKIDPQGCTCGNTIDYYHELSFENSLIDPKYYGGNGMYGVRIPQGVWPNVVPRDPRN